MMYLSIPKGMEFKQLLDNKNIRDYFIDPKGEKPSIDLQQCIKEALQYNKGRKKCINLEKFTLYTRMPPNTEELFLTYTPNRNGKFATLKEVKSISGKMAQKTNPQSLSRYGSFWYQQIPVSSDELKVIKAKQDEQRENRRHYGPSPTGT